MGAGHARIQKEIVTAIKEAESKQCVGEGRRKEQVERVTSEKDRR